jgi:hypothetical protein
MLASCNKKVPGKFTQTSQVNSGSEAPTRRYRARDIEVEAAAARVSPSGRKRVAQRVSAGSSREPIQPRNGAKETARPLAGVAVLFRPVPGLGVSMPDSSAHALGYSLSPLAGLVHSLLKVPGASRTLRNALFPGESAMPLL